LRHGAEQERETFNRVAALRLLHGVREGLAVADPSAWLDLRREPNERLRALLRDGLGTSRAGDPFGGRRVLELGGSGEATVGFLRAGARRVDQLDVSPGMLDLAEARLTAEQRSRVVQHVAAAESLPFDDDLFDVVYSRHCLHHMRRELVLPEVARVLKPSGWFLFIEPFLPTWLRRMVTVRRMVRGVDRGTDDPLTPLDLAHARRSFGEIDVSGTPNVAVLFRALPPLARGLGKLQYRRPLPPGLLRGVGGRVMVLAQEPTSSRG
jgi:SAM-dependent methyltransferase